MRFKLLIKSTNPPTMLLGTSSVVAGTASAYAAGYVDWWMAVFCLLFAIAGQMAGNLMVLWLDARNNWGYCESQHLQQYNVDEPLVSLLQEGMGAFTLLAATAGLYILAVAGLWTLLIALMLGMLILAINIGTNPTPKSPFFLLSTFLIYGPIGVIGTAFCEESVHISVADCFHFATPALMSSIIIGLQAMFIHVGYSAIASVCNCMTNQPRFTMRMSLRTSRVVGVGIAVLEYALLVLSMSPSEGTTVLAWWIAAVSVPFAANLVTALMPVSKDNGRKLLMASYWSTLLIAVIYLVFAIVIC